MTVVPWFRGSISAAWTIAAVTAFICIAAPTACAAIEWHDGLEAALDAAEQSEKPIFVFVYLGDQVQQSRGQRQQISIRREGSVATPQIDLEQMLRQILRDPDVMAAAQKFEALRLDLCDPRTDAARIALKVGPGVDASTDTRVGMYPITLFLDSSGEELFRRHGCMPAMGYSAQLEQAHNLFQKRKAVLDEPEDARKRRELGRAYMEMDPTPADRIYAAAIEHLEEAVRLDPQNETGANFDARVDLAILRIPQSTASAVRTLSELQSEDADGHRKLEIQYYVAVAHFVTEDYASAKQLLREFETDDDRSPYWDSPWTPQALGLLAYIKQLGR